MAMLQARNLARAYRFQAFGTLFSGAMKAQPCLMPNTGIQVFCPLLFYGFRSYKY